MLQKETIHFATQNTENLALGSLSKHRNSHGCFHGKLILKSSYLLATYAFKSSSLASVFLLTPYMDVHGKHVCPQGLL